MGMDFTNSSDASFKKLLQPPVLEIASIDYVLQTLNAYVGEMSEKASELGQIRATLAVNAPRHGWPWSDEVTTLGNLIDILKHLTSDNEQ